MKTLNAGLKNSILMVVWIFFLCSPDYPKQPRIEYPFYRFLHQMIFKSLPRNHFKSLIFQLHLCNCLITRPIEIIAASVAIGPFFFHPLSWSGPSEPGPEGYSPSQISARTELRQSFSKGLGLPYLTLQFLKPSYGPGFLIW